MLEYENQMFLEVLHEDGLVVTAKGLGLETVFTNVLKAYSDPGNLVIVLGTNDYEEKFFIDKLKSENTKYLPRVITGECHTNDRNIVYLEGGVLFITGRLFVVDLLMNRVPLELVTGILVYKAHNIMNSCQEAFALRLYRQKNKTGFIKAFSNSALAFTVGFAQVERVIKTLFVKNLYLWPRFHSVVNNSLQKCKPDVIELHVNLTPRMLQIQTALLDIMNHLVKEFKNLNKYLDLECLTVENAVAKKFHKQLQSQLDPVWHQLSSATKVLLADMKTVRHLIISLTLEDAVTYYSMVANLSSKEYALSCSGWILLDAFEDLLRYSRARVYTDKDELEDPEANPKWNALSEILKEIQRDKVDNGADKEDLKKVLVLVQDRNTCNQLKNYLVSGAKEYLICSALKKLKSNKLSAQSSNEKEDAALEESESKNSTENEEENSNEEQDSYILTLSQKPSSPSQKAQNESMNDNNADELPATQLFEQCSQLQDLDLTSFSSSAPIIAVQSYKKGGDPMALQRTLTEMTPRYVVMYTADISAVRQFEVYQNNYPSIKLKIYFLVFADSVEEQAYLTSLRREKEAFDMLIKTKATMVVPTDQDGKADDCLALARDSDFTEENTRKGGLSGDSKKMTVIVDMREFRSELPSLLHKRGIEIEPLTITVGDYILSPEICVERKSINDLIGSLNSGRLYNQCVAMTRYYPIPMLLIEFDQNKPFSFQGNYYLSKDMRSLDITSKLQLLTLHFPKLKLVWSPSPHATAQLFEELKEGRLQPDGARAMQIGLDESVDDKKVMLEKFNIGIQDFVLKLPGVNTRNLRAVLNKGKSLDHLIKMSKVEIIEILGEQNGSLLYGALHDKTKPEEATNRGAGRGTSRGRGRRFFSKKKS